MQDEKIIAAFIALGMAVMKTFDYLVKNGSKDNRTLSEKEYYLLKSVYDVISAKDSDGVHMIYLPRQLIKSQNENTQAIKDLTVQQQRNAVALEHLIKLLERHLDK